MSIRLLYPIFLAGVLSPVDGSTLTLPAALEADLVNQGKAEWVSLPPLSRDAGGRVGSIIDRTTGQPKGLLVGSRTMYTSWAPKDLLDRALPQTSFTAAMSVTVGALFAGGVGNSARIAWLNNGGADGSLLYIAVNPLNAVEGAAAAKDPKRRDYTLTLGNAVILESDVIIQSVFCIPNASITSAQHSLQLKFGD